MEEEKRKQFELAKELVFLTTPSSPSLLDYKETPDLLRRTANYRIPYFPGYIHLQFCLTSSTKGPKDRDPSELPFTTSNLLSIKDSFSHQPNPLEVGAVLQQAREDAKALVRVSELQSDGLLQSKRVTRSTEPPIGENRRDVLHKEVEWMAEYIKDERERKIQESKKTGKVYWIGISLTWRRL